MFTLRSWAYGIGVNKLSRRRIMQDRTTCWLCLHSQTLRFQVWYWRQITICWVYFERPPPQKYQCQTNEIRYQQSGAVQFDWREFVMALKANWCHLVGIVATEQVFFAQSIMVAGQGVERSTRGIPWSTPLIAGRLMPLRLASVWAGKYRRLTPRISCQIRVQKLKVTKDGQFELVWNRFV